MLVFLVYLHYNMPSISPPPQPIKFTPYVVLNYSVHYLSCAVGSPKYNIKKAKVTNERSGTVLHYLG